MSVASVGKSINLFIYLFINNLKIVCQANRNIIGLYHGTAVFLLSIYYPINQHTTYIDILI